MLLCYKISMTPIPKSKVVVLRKRRAESPELCALAQLSSDDELLIQPSQDKPSHGPPQDWSQVMQEFMPKLTHHSAQNDDAVDWQEIRDILGPRLVHTSTQTE